MTLSVIEEILGGAIGLNAASIGHDAVEQAVHLRMRAAGIEQLDDYLPKLQASIDELDELIEAIVVPETWFFRHPESFAALSESVRSECFQEQPRTTLRILSVPSSTGEEPYSIVMALLDGGVPPDRCCVEALDISRRALAYARHAVFGPNSFRNEDLGFRERYFRPGPSGYHLAEGVRERVHFRQANLLAPDFLGKNDLFDVIFCRNILIYFNRQAQQQVVDALDRALAPTGLLFVGPAEGFLVRSCGFRSTLQPMAFAYRKPGLPGPESAPSAPAPLKKRSVGPAAKSRKKDPVASSTNISNVAPLQSPGSPKPGDLAAARRLADAGRLGESLKECEIHLRVHGPSAEAYYLMGLLRDAAGDDQGALEFHRKVLYLEPRHLEALAHLALLEEKRGDKAMASRLRARIERMEETSDPQPPRSPSVQ